MANSNTNIEIDNKLGIATYTDWSGEDVAVTKHQPTEATYTEEEAITISESEYGGSYSVAEAIEMLEHIQAPAEIIEWVRGAQTP